MNDVFKALADPTRRDILELLRSGRKFEGAYEGIILTVLVFMLAMHLIILRAAMGHQISMQKVMPIGMGTLFIAIGNLLPRARSNFFVGIRTPWTLSSEKSWERTHRVGGYVFVLIGIVMAASVFVPISTGWPMVAGIAGCAILGLIAYSYMVWRDGPDKRGFFSPR